MDEDWIQDNDCQIIIGADCNTNIDGDIFRDSKSIKPKSKKDEIISKAKIEAFDSIMI